MTAVSSFNLGPDYIRRLHKQATKESPGKFTKLYISKLSKHKSYSRRASKSSSKKISTSKLISLSQEIIDIFPGENKQTYYIPYRKENGKVTPTRGKLWDKYCNLRRELRKLCTTNKLQNEVVSTSVNYNKGILFFFNAVR